MAIAPLRESGDSLPGRHRGRSPHAVIEQIDTGRPGTERFVISPQLVLRQTTAAPA